MPKPYAVVFAGVPGTSKSPISCYLSQEFGLPIINTDQIRYEIQEDWRIPSLRHREGAQEEFNLRLHERLGRLLANQTPFIFDGSQDREWAERRALLVDNGYSWFMIDIELSPPFLRELYGATDRQDFADHQLPRYLSQHEAFMAQHSGDVSLMIDDSNFDCRLTVAANGLRGFLSARQDEPALNHSSARLLSVQSQPLPA